MSHGIETTSRKIEDRIIANYLLVARHKDIKVNVKRGQVSHVKNIPFMFIDQTVIKKKDK